MTKVFAIPMVAFVKAVNSEEAYKIAAERYMESNIDKWTLDEGIILDESLNAFEFDTEVHEVHSALDADAVTGKT